EVDTTLDLPPPGSPLDSWPPLAGTVPLAESAPPPAADADAEPEERFAAPPPKPQGPSSSSHATAEDEDLDLDPARRRQIQDLYDRLEDLDHYTVLDVPRSADKKAIRDAYFRLSKQFHPDTLFGKKIGSYRFKMERVFKRLTEAYEVLGKKKRRAPYDEYLALKDRTAAIQSGLAQGAVVAERVATASRPPVDGAGSWEEADAPEDVDTSTDGRVHVSEAPGSGATPSVDPGVRRRVARDLLERRLRGATGHRRRYSDDIEAPATSKDQVLRRLTNSLRDAAKLTGGTSRYDAYVRAGDAAMEKDDLVTAVNSFRLALAMKSEPDAEVQERYESLRLRLATQMAESYERQGRYEEQSGRWRDAARSWLKVVDGRPGEVKPLRRAAAAFLKSDGDLRQARDLAKRAVELSPDDVAGHVLLARIFYAAGMSASAIQQLQTAAKLDPTNKTVKNLLAEMK
ncbi:MAG: DnaJ domain-containing protein, partial [Myxococcota bacterium]